MAAGRGLEKKEFVMSERGTEAVIGQTWLKGRLQYRTNPDGTCEAVGYYESGAPKFRYPIRDGEIRGVGRTWYEDGMLESEESYRRGVLHGPAHYWYADGIMKNEAHYQNGLWHGIQKRWFPSGVLATQRTYSNNRMNGPAFAWHPNGKLKIRANFINDQRSGFFERYAEDGELIKKEAYARGVAMPVQKYEKLLAGQLSAKDILGIKNAEVRRIFIEEFGYARLLAGMPHKVIDRDGEQELVRIDWDEDEEPICLVKVRCPSTGAFYTLRVPPVMKTVKAAVAWTFDVPSDNYIPEKET